MIKEDYVSLEIAKLLKDKGFLKGVDLRMTQNLSFYDNIGLSYNINKYYDSLIQDKIDFVVAPTLQMAMKWLREVHNIGIFPSTYTHIADRKTIHSYGTAIINLKTYELMTDSYLSNDTYEDAVETAIKYCLENLI